MLAPRGAGATVLPHRVGGYGHAVPARRLLVLALGALIVVVALAQSVGISKVISPSMEPRLATGDRVVINKLAPELFGLARGDIAVFEDPGGWADASARSHGEIAHGSLIVKRVIGVGGDRVMCCSPDGAIILNGRPLAEPYVPRDARRTLPLAFDVVVPEDSFWMMGDNRARSFDSSALADSAGQGFVPASRIVGRVETTF